MEQYKNLSGDSGVLSYEAHKDAITVCFRDGWLYSYTIRSAGHRNIESMIQLAHAGRGLNSYINRAARKSYEEKWR